MASPYPTLFSPISLGRAEARNRIMRTATTSNLAEKQRVSDRMVAFYRALAAGGVGSIVTESVAVHPSYSGGNGTLQLYDPDGIPGLKRLTEAVRSEGALFFCQLRHGGRQHHARQTPMLWAPSAIACPHSGTIPHAMTLAEVEEVIAGFVTSALHAKAAGFDGVEIQGGHGHLVQEFISAFSNQRDDAFGGSRENRLRFPREIVRRVREAVGPDYPVGYRLGVDEFTPGGITLDDSTALGVELAAAGRIDYLSYTQGNFYSIETHLPDRRFPPNSFVTSHHARITQAVRAVSRIPVVTTGRIRVPEDAEAILAAGHGDMIGMCRQLIADPQWPAKARGGRAAEIRRCTNGNHCWSRIRSGDPLGCELNPVIGREAEWTPRPPAAQPKRTVVVGGGPAGLEAARVAAEAGHAVTLIERAAVLGGRLATATGVAGHAEVQEHVPAAEATLRRLGVTIALGAAATPESIAALAPDAVLVATGATPTVPTLAGDGSVPVTSAAAALPAGAAATTVVVYDEDGDNWAAFETEAAAAKGHRVILATRYFETLRDLPMVTRITTLKRLDEIGVTLMPDTEIARIQDGGVVLRHAYSGRETPVPQVAGVVWVGRLVANDGLAAALRAAGIPKVELIGDAYAPRRLFNATLDGHRVARAL